MSIDTFTPTPKDLARQNFQRSDRTQDHGTAANTLDRLYKDERAIKNRIKEKLARKVLDDELAGLSPSQLEKVANTMLATAEESADDKSAHLYEEYQADLSAIEDMEAQIEKEDVDEETPSSAYTNEHGLSREMAIRRQMRGRRGSTSSPDFTYEGTHGDDEDLGDTAAPMGGYQIR